MLNWRSPKLCNPMPLFKTGPCGLALYALTIQLTVDDVDDEANDGAKQNSLLSELTPGWLHNHHKHIPAEHFWTNVTKCQPNRNGSDSVENKPLSLGLLCVYVWIVWRNIDNRIVVVVPHTTESTDDFVTSQCRNWEQVSSYSVSQLAEQWMLYNFNVTLKNWKSLLGLTQQYWHIHHVEQVEIFSKAYHDRFAVTAHKSDQPMV